MTGGRDESAIERLLVESYPDLALLLRRTASMHAWQPSDTGERVLRELAAAVADVLERRLPPEEANVAISVAIATTTDWLATQRRSHGQSGTRHR